MDEMTRQNVTIALKIPKHRFKRESYELNTMRHSSDSKYISRSYWKEIASKMQLIGMATMYSGAFSSSLSKWLSKAKAIDATEIEIARCMIEFLTLKQHIFTNQRDARTKSGMKHCKTLCSIIRI